MSESLVVDASVALKWFVVEDDTVEAERLLGWTEELHAPDLLLVEVANALRKNVRKRIIAPEQALSGLSTVPRIIDRLHRTELFLPDALNRAFALDHPIYDLCYLALARSIGVRLVTADERFIRKFQNEPEASYLIHLRDLP